MIRHVRAVHENKTGVVYGNCVGLVRAMRESSESSEDPCVSIWRLYGWARSGRRADFG